MDDDADPGRPRRDLAPAPHPDHDELERLVTGFPPTARPAVHAANRVIGAVDELGRLLAGFLIGVTILIALAFSVSPWFWLAAAAWTLWGVATIVWFVVRRRRPRPRAITPVTTVDPAPRRPRE